MDNLEEKLRLEMERQLKEMRIDRVEDALFLREQCRYISPLSILIDLTTFCTGGVYDGARRERAATFTEHRYKKMARVCSNQLWIGMTRYAPTFTLDAIKRIAGMPHDCMPVIISLQELYFPMIMRFAMDNCANNKEAFERIVSMGLRMIKDQASDMALIPSKFIDKLENVSIVIGREYASANLIAADEKIGLKRQPAEPAKINILTKSERKCRLAALNKRAELVYLKRREQEEFRAREMARAEEKRMEEDALQWALEQEGLVPKSRTNKGQPEKVDVIPVMYLSEIEWWGEW